MRYRGRSYVVQLVLLVSLTVAGRAHADEAASPEASPEPTARPVPKPGSYESDALQLALHERDLIVDDAPEGKRLGRIVVVNLDVFGKEEGGLRFFNFLHVTTREHVIEREVLLRPGELWDEERIAETQRKLKDPLFTSLVVITPVKSAKEGLVDLMVVTRDIWSLRMNSTFEYLQGTLIGLQLSIAENNIFGLRKHGAVVFDMNQGSYTVGPQYVDKALAGTRLQLVTRFNTIFARDTNAFEGTSSGTSLVYPLWSLRQKWGGDIAVTHSDFTARSFQGTELETVDLDATPEVEALERIFTVKSLRVTSRVNRSFGHDVKQTVSLGHSFSVLRPGFIDGYVASEAERAAFADQVFPRSERVSAVFARYRLFTPKFVIYHNLNTFDLAEDVRLGPDLSAGLSLALTPIGSETTFYQPDVSASYVFDIAEDGFVRGAASASSRIESGELIDNILRTSLKVATPSVARSFRVVAKANLGVRLRERGNGRFILGGNSGLRGYLISQFSGQKEFISNVEVRSLPVRILFARAGGLVFWDMGHTADRLSELRMKHSVGIGLRTLVPQLQPIVFRFDWAFPLQDASAGFPGRISAGVAQVF